MSRPPPPRPMRSETSSTNLTVRKLGGSSIGGSSTHPSAPLPPSRGQSAALITESSPANSSHPPSGNQPPNLPPRDSSPRPTRSTPNLAPPALPNRTISPDRNRGSVAQNRQKLESQKLFTGTTPRGSERPTSNRGGTTSNKSPATPPVGLPASPRARLLLSPKESPLSPPLTRNHGPSPTPSLPAAAVPFPPLSASLSSTSSHSPSRSKDERTNIAREIFETEKKFVESLYEMIEVYFKPLLKASEDPNNHLKKADITLMFSNVEILYNLNKNILDQLEEKIKDWSPTQMIGDVFKQFAPFLKMYTAYGQGYQQALDTYNALVKDNPKFQELLTQYRGSRPLTLEHLLIMPVQRIPRYNLLLSDLLKKTETSHCDYANIEAAIKAVEEAASHMNQTMRKSEQMMRLVTAANTEAFAGLLEASRTLLMDGVFTVDLYHEYPSCVSSFKQDLFTGPLGKKTDKFHLFCFNDTLVYVLKSDVKRTKDVLKSGTNMRFNLVWVEERGEATLAIKSPNRTLVVHFPTPAEKSKWLTELSKNIFDSLVPYPTGDTPTPSSSSPNPPPLLRYGEYAWEVDKMNYKGWWLSGKLHDQGEFFCNGNTYTGDFVGGLRQGNGQLKYSNGALYVGEFAKDLPNGEGTLTSSSNEIYTGNFKDGRPHGEGTLGWPNGDRCTGEWENGRLNGRVKYIRKKGISYDGLVQDNLPHGQGTLTMGSFYYMGSFECGERHGVGLLDYGNGLKYEGHWENDRYHGRGVWWNIQSGDKYEGEWVNGKKCGMGKMTFGNGDQYEGQWKHDAFHGKGDITYSNGDSYSGGWRSNKYHGNGTYTQGTGHKIEGKWSMGQMEGTAKVESSTWTVTKTGFTVPIADMVVNFEPLVEFPRQILLRF